ncbi:hypothetical protein [Priestia megaterium]|uniref:hypothetical protein n=1 Tax=Priestia megaterium TaxID=1404 RepID=UPI000BFBC9A2|nr:hypothetical protein [Priestia megaterium]PGN04328.1 hypothetical protein CN955_21400 [Priestia megaterium]
MGMKEEVHQEFYKSRLEYNNKWPNKILNNDSCTNLQENFLQLLKKHNMNQLFSPLKLKDIDNPVINVTVSYIIDALDQLPQRPDIAFDQIWRALDYQFHYLKRTRNWNDKNRTLGMMEQTVNELLCDYLRNNKYNAIKKMVRMLAGIIPNQTGEYIARRLFDEEGESAASHVIDHQSRIQDRFKNSIFQNDLYREFESKYEFIKKQEQLIRDTKIFKLEKDLKSKVNRQNIQRKINKLKVSPSKSSAIYQTGRLACYLVNGETIEFTLEDKKVKYNLSDEQLMKLIVLGLLYTYRNERFHGSIFSSTFRSSNANLNTYAHAYYMFILAYFILLTLIAPILHDECSEYHSLEEVFDEISNNILNNTKQFETIFSKQIFKKRRNDIKV